MNLKDYIRGQRQGKEANQLERKAMDDPFLQDAIDGFDSVEGDHMAATEDLEKRVSSPQKRVHRRLWLWAAAAVIVLLIGTPLLLDRPYTEKEIPMASSDIIQQRKENKTPSLQKDTILIAEHPEKEEKNISRATTPDPVRKETSGKTVASTVAPVKPEVEIIESVAEEIEPVPDKEIRLSTAQHVSEKTTLEAPLKEITEALAGRAAGVTVSQQEQDKTIRIRGISKSTLQPDRLFVSGRIVDETGEPIPGVTVHIPNTLTGTVSDMEGNFQLFIPKDEQKELIASYIGMKNSSIPLIENAGDIMMKADDMALNEVVIVAFGTQKKATVVGAVSAIKDTTTFGEEEFRNYFTKNYDKEICAGQKIIIAVEFFIDPMGRPAHIDIRENSCPALESEIKRLLLGSPLWSKTNRKVTLQIELP
ncbi:carboxypeptidase-like regulatory domain-containing protein [Proteiniphilum acetatigenes]|uniref:carboxypeptidase-like regulatory domain-containing protein n=1 Tax=Proteiniphilum acetatigenes TaxID=294710 RepID=UPI00035DF5B4|nr:carboxypeptidase-like regulatory domain-containing protein [Proteiniphilum acetatigenes]